MGLREWVIRRRRSHVGMTYGQFERCALPDFCVVCMEPATEHRGYGPRWVAEGVQGTTRYRGSGYLPAKQVPYCARHAAAQDAHTHLHERMLHEAGIESEGLMGPHGKRWREAQEKVRAEFFAEYPELVGLSDKAEMLGVRFALGKSHLSGSRVFPDSVQCRFANEEYGAKFRGRAA